jgi:hypothetical protein
VVTQIQPNPDQRNAAQLKPIRRIPSGDLRHDVDTVDPVETAAEAGADDETVDVEIIEESTDGGAEDLAPRAEELAPLFSPENAADYRARWDVVQRGFVDDPARAVRDGDALVSEVISTLAQTFADEGSSLDSSRKTEASTEVLRRALQRHRAFFERLLAF